MLPGSVVVPKSRRRPGHRSLQPLQVVRTAEARDRVVLGSAKEGEVIVLGADDVGHEIFLAQTFSHSSLKVVAGCDQCNSTT